MVALQEIFLGITALQPSRRLIIIGSQAQVEESFPDSLAFLGSRILRQGGVDAVPPLPQTWKPGFGG